jgi:hypothetical protein
VVANLSSLTVVPQLPADVVSRWRGADVALTNLEGDDAADAPLDPWEARVYLS